MTIEDVAGQHEPLRPSTHACQLPRLPSELGEQCSGVAADRSAAAQVALGEYRDVEVSTSSGEDEAGVPTFRVSFSESPTEAEVNEKRGVGGQQWH